MRAARGRGARAGLGRAVQAVGAGQLARPRAEGGRLPRPGLVTQTCRGLGGRGEVLGDLDVAVGGHLVLEQQRLPPLLGQGSLPRGAAACTGVTVEAAPGSVTAPLGTVSSRASQLTRPRQCCHSFHVEKLFYLVEVRRHQSGTHESTPRAAAGQPTCNSNHLRV